MQHPHSPVIGHWAGVGFSELSPTCCSLSTKWAGATDSRRVAPTHPERPD